MVLILECVFSGEMTLTRDSRSPSSTPNVMVTQVLFICRASTVNRTVHDMMRGARNGWTSGINGAIWTRLQADGLKHDPALILHDLCSCAG